jgi:hypothetical protein
MPGFATSLELVSNEPTGSIFEWLQLTEPPQFVVAALTLPNGQQPPWNLGQLELKNNNTAFVQPQNDEQTYVDQRGNLVIVNSTSAADLSWSINVYPAIPPLPMAVNVMAFHGSLIAAAPPAPAVVVPGPTFRCRGCKVTAKALALAIVAAATLPAIPAALIAAVAAYLGVSAVIAAAFIGSLIGDTADLIAEKLCKKIGLC